MKKTNCNQIDGLGKCLAFARQDPPEDRRIKTRNLRSLLKGIACGLGLAISSSGLAQELINIDIVTSGRGPTAGLPAYNGQGVLGGPFDIYWNACYDTNSTLNGLLDSIGNATSIGITVSGGSFWSDATGGNVVPSGNFTDLLGDYYFASGTGVMTVNLTGLDPNSTYEVVSYSVGDNAGQGGVYGGALSGTSVGNTRSALLVSSNYVDNLPVAPNSAGTISFTIGAMNGTGTATFNGLQIQKLVPNLYAPIITNEPASLAIRQGRTAAFNVAADTGSEAPFYQWYFGSSPVVGATNATLIITNVNSLQAGNYNAIITNLSGSATSSVAVLTVDTTTTTSLFIGGDPGQGLDLLGANFDIAEYYAPQDNGPLTVQNVTLTNDTSLFTSAFVSLMGLVAPNFGIDQNDLNLSLIANDYMESDATYDPLTLSIPTVLGESYKLQLIFHDTFNTASGKQQLAVTIGSEVVEPALDVAGQGGGGANAQGVVVSYYFTGTGSPLPVTISNIVNTGFAAMNALTLQVLPPAPQTPYFVFAPQNQTNVQGSTATFSALAGGSLPPFSYQWYFGAAGIAGATNTVLTLPNVRLTNAGTYSVVASNSAGAVTNSAILAVNNNVSLGLSTGPASGQGLNLQGNFVLAEYYYNTTANLPNLPIGGALFVPSTRAGTSGAYLSSAANSPNFGPNSDQLNLGSMSAYSAGGNPNFAFDTTAGDTYNLQIILHDGYFTTANSRVFNVLAISSQGVTNTLATHLDLAAQGAYTSKATNVVISFIFIGDGGPMNIQFSSTANSGCITALTLQDLTAPAAPVFLTSLPTQAAYLGDTVTLLSHVSGSSLACQWQQESGGVFKNIPGATNYSLTISNIGIAGFTNYALVVTNSLGSVSSTGMVEYLAFNPHTLIGHWLSGSQSLAESSGYAPAGTHDGVIATGTGNSPAIGATPVWADDVPPGFAGSSLDLSTVASTFVMVSNSASADPGYWPTFDRSMTNGYTVTVWAKGWPVNNYGVFVGKRGETSGSTSAGYQFRRSSNGQVAPSSVQYGSAQPGEQTSWLKTTNDTAHWHHYAFTWDGASGVRRVYVDNVLAVNLVNDTNLLVTYTPAHLGFGARQDNLSGGWGNFAQVKLFDVRVYGYALAPSDIQNINQEPAGANPFTVVSGPAIGQGLDLQENFVLAEYYGGTNANVTNIIGGAVFATGTNRFAGSSTVGNTPNFGSSSDQKNLAVISSQLKYASGLNLSVPTTVGHQYKLQLLFHDNTYTAVGKRQFLVQIGTNNMTLIATNAQQAALQDMLDIVAGGACVTNPVDLVLPYTFTATSNSLPISMINVRDYPLLNALTLADLSLPVTPPVVLVQVNSVTNNAGGLAQLVANVAGAQVTFQWQKWVNGVFTNLLDGGRISGSANNVLAIANLGTADAGTYRVVVTNSAGSVSSAGTVAVIIPVPTLVMGPLVDGRFSLSWSTNSALESTTNLSGGNWTIVSSNSPLTIVPVGFGNEFFRVISTQ